MVTPVPISAAGGTSIGYGGTILETNFSIVDQFWGKQYCVGSEGAWAPSVVPAADRTIQFAPGQLYGGGILDTTTSALTIQLDPIASGSRWDLVIARRSGSGPGGTTVVTAVTATTGGDIPGTLNHTLGVLDDQPLALVQVTAGQSLPTAVVDLRVWQSNGGGVAVSEKVLQYLAAPGTQVAIGTTLWTRIVSAAGVASWQRTDLESRVARLWSASDPSLRIWPAGTGHMISLTVAAARAGWYRVDALAVVRQASGSTQPYQKMFTLNGAQYGMAVMDELPNATWCDRSLARAFLWLGGPFTVSYLGLTSGSDTTVQLAELYATYLGASGW